MLAHRTRASVALLLSCLYLTNAGDFDANCQFSTEWIKHQSDWTSAVWADLSECQQDTLGVPQNKITLGGKGGSSTIGIDLGSGGDGCDGGTDCMEMCQALCCATKDCDIAMVHKDTEKECEVSCDIYKEGRIPGDSSHDSDVIPTMTNFHVLHMQRWIISNATCINRGVRNPNHPSPLPVTPIPMHLITTIV